MVWKTSGHALCGHDDKQIPRESEKKEANRKRKIVQEER